MGSRASCRGLRLRLLWLCAGLCRSGVQPGKRKKAIPDDGVAFLLWSCSLEPRSARARHWPCRSQFESLPQSIQLAFKLCFDASRPSALQIPPSQDPKCNRRSFDSLCSLRMTAHYWPLRMAAHPSLLRMAAHSWPFRMKVAERSQTRETKIRTARWEA